MLKTRQRERETEMLREKERNCEAEREREKLCGWNRRREIWRKTQPYIDEERESEREGRETKRNRDKYIGPIKT